MKNRASILISLLCSLCAASAQVPRLIPHQGRIAVDSVNFDGTGTFKFLIYVSNTVKPDDQAIWSNESTEPTSLSEPTAGVSVPVTKGLYSLQLGSAPQKALPASITVASDEELKLRIWFDDGVNGSQLLSPDQNIGTVPFALTAANALTEGQLITAGFVKTDAEGNITIPGKIKTPALRVFKKLIPAGALGLQQADRTTNSDIHQAIYDGNGGIRGSRVSTRLSVPVELPVGSTLTNIGIYMTGQGSINRIRYRVNKATFNNDGSINSPEEILETLNLPQVDQPREPLTDQMGDYVLPTPITIEENSFYSLYFDGLAEPQSVSGFVLTYTHDALVE